MLAKLSSGNLISVKIKKKKVFSVDMETLMAFRLTMLKLYEGHKNIVLSLLQIAVKTVG